MVDEYRGAAWGVALLQERRLLKRFKVFELLMPTMRFPGIRGFVSDGFFRVGENRTFDVLLLGVNQSETIPPVLHHDVSRQDQRTGKETNQWKASGLWLCGSS